VTKCGHDLESSSLALKNGIGMMPIACTCQEMDFWVEVFVIFGLGLGYLGLVWVEISLDLGIPTRGW
jgi:hypothetical protein